MMDKRVLTLIVIAGMALCSCGAPKVALSPNTATTTFECIQMTGDNSCIVNVQEMGRDIQAASSNAIKYAVNELLFNGIPGSSSNRIPFVKPLIPNSDIKEANRGYFESLFSSGDYRRYAELFGSMPPQVVKTNSGYKVTVTLVVKKELLRKKLEYDGIIKSLSNVL